MKRIVCLALVMVPISLSLSCSKENSKETESAAAVLGIEVKNALPLYEVNERQSINIEVAVTADPTPSEGYTVTIGANPGLVSFYNETHGTSYEMLPAEAYSLLSNAVMLPRYSAKSTYCQVRLKGMGCEAEKIYVLPIAIDGVRGGTNFEAPNEKAAYILFKMLPTDEEGKGTEASPYLLKTTDDFLKMDSMLMDDATTYFKMTADVDFSGVEFTEEKPWVPVDASGGRKIAFNGDGHTISNFKSGASLFYILDGSVENLVIDGAEIDCMVSNVGGVLAGDAGAVDGDGKVVGQAMIKNVTVKNSSITNANKRTGGLIGWLIAGTVDNVDVDCTVTGGQQVGGLIGRIDSGTVSNSCARGDVNSDSYYTGGLVGFMDNGLLKNCHASGKVDNVLPDGNYSRVGGLVGEMHGGSVEQCSATGEVGGNGHFGGGLIGVADASVADITITRSFATGYTAYTPSSGNKAGYGALVGRMEQGILTISDCYSTGAVKAFRWSAGFVGDVNKGKLTIVNGFSSSDLSAIGPDGNGNYECGIVVGKVRDADNTTITCAGFVAWNVSDAAFCFPADAVPVTGNYYGKEGTISSQASALGWSSDIWDLSASEPKLK